QTCALPIAGSVLKDYLASYLDTANYDSNHCDELCMKCHLNNLPNNPLARSPWLSSKLVISYNFHVICKNPASTFKFFNCKCSPRTIRYPTVVSSSNSSLSKLSSSFTPLLSISFR